MIKQVKHKLGRQTLITLYHTFMYPYFILVYCNIVSVLQQKNVSITYIIFKIIIITIIIMYFT